VLNGKFIGKISRGKAGKFPGTSNVKGGQKNQDNRIVGETRIYGVLISLN